MFTGIVEELGEITAVTELADAARVAIAGPVVTQDARHGDSIAVNGVCLTVVDVADGVFTADVMRETLVRSSLAGARPGDRVNLERAATLGSRLGGHLVQGHVDGVGTVVAREPGEHWVVVRFALPPELARYVVTKGSIAVDGVSLTVVDVTDAGPDGDPASAQFSVSLIPTTLQLTTLAARDVGASVNLEVDVVAKYVERLAAPHLAAAGPALTGHAAVPTAGGLS